MVVSRNKAILTDKIYRENQSWKRDKLRDALRRVLQVEELIVVPKEPLEPFGHSDAMVRFINHSTVMMNDYGGLDQPFGNRLAKALCHYGLTIELIPYCPEPHSTNGVLSAVGCYVNYLRTEKVVLVPIFGIEHDQNALRRLKFLIPEIPVVSLDCANLAREGGILNCVTATYRMEPKVQKH